MARAGRRWPAGSRAARSGSDDSAGSEVHQFEAEIGNELARGLANLVITRSGGLIVLNPHVTGQCVVELDEDAAAAVRDTLAEWLG